MTIEIGVPVVTCCGRRSSENTPERMRTASGSWRWVTNLPWPGRRFSSQTCTSASVSAMPGGQPSTTQPSAGPWLSPQVVTRNRWPNVLCDMAGLVAASLPQTNLRPPQRLAEERQRRLQRPDVGRALRQGDLADRQVGAALGAAGGYEIIVADAGQNGELGARDGAGGRAAVGVGRGDRVGLAEHDGDRRVDRVQAGRIEGLDEGRRHGEDRPDAADRAVVAGVGRVGCKL